MKFIDNSILSDFAACPRAGYVHHVLHRTGQGSHFASIGSLMHDVLAIHFTGGSLADCQAKFWVNIGTIERPVDDSALTAENLWSIMCSYIMANPVHSFPFEITDTVEQTIQVPILPDVMYVGKRDLLVKMPTGEYSALDHKTRFGHINEYWLAQFKYSSQLTGYIWMQEQLGLPTQSVWINAIQLTKLPDSSRRCPEHKVSYCECSLQHAKWGLYQYYRTPDQVADWLQATQKLIKVFLATADNEIKAEPIGLFSKHCRFCDLSEWCTAGAIESDLPYFTTEYNWQPWL